MKVAGTMIRREEVEFFLRLHDMWEGIIAAGDPIHARVQVGQSGRKLRGDALLAFSEVGRSGRDRARNVVETSRERGHHLLLPVGKFIEPGREPV